MKSFLKQMGGFFLLTAIYTPALFSWLIFVPSFKLAHYIAKKFQFNITRRWSWLGVDADDY